MAFHATYPSGARPNQGACAGPRFHVAHHGILPESLGYCASSDDQLTKIVIKTQKKAGRRNLSRNGDVTRR